jgi:hypothetical protein
MQLFHFHPQEFPVPRREALVRWLDSDAALDFDRLLRSRMAQALARIAENTCENAENFMAAKETTREHKELLTQVSRLSICLKVITEIRQELARQGRPEVDAIQLLQSLTLV